MSAPDAPSPLSGRTIGVTADHRADAQIKLLEARGATVIHGPVIQTHPTPSEETLRANTEALIAEPPEVLVMTTGLGVRTWFSAADDLGLGDALRSSLTETEFLARGPKAASAIAAAGFAVSWTAARYDDVISRLVERGVGDVRVGHQRDGSASDDLGRRIVDLGADLVELPVYRWALPDDDAAARALIEATVAGEIDGLTFTAKPAVEHLFEIADLMGVTDALVDRLSTTATAFCVGPVCATGFDDHPGVDVAVPERFQLAALVHLVAERLDGTR